MDLLRPFLAFLTKEHIKKKPDLAKLIPYLSGNIGFIFTKLKPLSLKNILYENKVPAPAKSGQKAPDDVEIPSGITTLTPDGTSFFQALNIQTKIAKGFIEIVNPVKIITKNQIIGNSEVILLQKLNIVPFSHQIKIKLIYENECCIDPEILEISMDNIQNIYCIILHIFNGRFICMGKPSFFRPFLGRRKVRIHIRRMR